MTKLEFFKIEDLENIVKLYKSKCNSNIANSLSEALLKVSNRNMSFFEGMLYMTLLLSDPALNMFNSEVIVQGMRMVTSNTLLNMIKKENEEEEDYLFTIEELDVD